ncbi:hypothetical protein [Streptomyces sp. NEAU-LD23]|uniref:hypothetical protein n=1 Tax=Streptomyces botrytidirepellens TaxID=2486417 RepID=UPI0016201841
MAAELGDEAARQPGFGVRARIVLRTGGAVQQPVQGGAFLRGLPQAVGDQIAQAVRQPGQVGLLLGDAVHHRVHTAVGGAEGLAAGGGEGEHRAEAEDVAGGGDAFAAG